MEEYEKNSWDSLRIGIGNENNSTYHINFYENKPKSCVTFDFLDRNKDNEIINALKLFIYYFNESRDFIVSDIRKEKKKIRGVESYL